MAERYYIACKDQWVGNNYLWWRPDRRGYTDNIAEAGLYDEAEARSIERLRGQEIAVPESVVLKNVVRVVQTLHALECARWQRQKCNCAGAWV